MTIDIQKLLMHSHTDGHRSMGVIHYIVLCVCSLMICSVNVSGQCMLSGLDIDKRIAQSEAIITGRIIQSSGLLKADGNIYTEYQVVSERDTILIEKMGGTVGDLTQVIQPDVAMISGDIGIFFLNKKDEIRWSLSCGPYSFIKYNTDIDAYTDVVGQYDKKIIHHTFSTFANQWQSIEQYHHETSRLIPPTITGIDPTTVTAGTESVVTITGFNFGSNAIGQSAIELRNPDVGVLITAYQPVPPNHILSWSDTKIKFIVPGRDPLAGHPGAGSGVFRLKNNIGELGYSPALTVLYNRYIIGATKQINLMDDNDKGGYTLTYNAAFKSNDDAYQAHQKAIKTWQCTNRSNITLSDITTTKNCPANDGINLVAFDDACPLTTGVLAQTTHWYITCSDGRPFFLEMDMIFDKQAKWSYTETNTDVTKFDFETTALHELGHLHGIGHSLVAGSTMFPNIFPGTTSRFIDEHTKTVANIISNDSEAAINTCSIARYKAGPSCKDTCKLQLLKLSESPCINGKVTYSFTVVNVNSGNAFDLFIDGIYKSSMDYGASGTENISIEIASDLKKHVVTIIDKAESGCAATIELNPVDCACKIDASLTSTGACIGDSIIYTVNVTNTKNVSNDFFIFIDNVKYLTSDYTNNNVNVAVIADGASHSIKVIDAIDTACYAITKVITPICRCSIDADLSFEKCMLGNAQYQLILHHQNTGSAYQVYFDDSAIGGPKSYDGPSQTTTVIDLPSDVSGIVKVVDVDKNYCSVEKNTTTPDCDCKTMLEVSNDGDCDKDSVYISVTITMQNAIPDIYYLYGNDSLFKKIVVDDDFFGPFTIKIKQPANGSSGNIMKLISLGNGTCKTTTTYNLPLCECSNQLSLTPLYDCDSDGNTHIQATIIHHDNISTSFDVIIANVKKSYNYSNTDSTIFTITLPGNGFAYTIKVMDGIDTTCFDTETITTYNCACGLVANIVETNPCNDDGTQIYNIRMTNNIKPTFVDVYVDGNKANVLPLSTEVFATQTYPIQVTADGKVHTVKIQDNADTACISTLALQTSDCRCFEVSFIEQVILCDTSGFTLWAVAFNELPQDISIKLDGQDYKNIAASLQSTTLYIPVKGDGFAHILDIANIDGRCNKTLNIPSGSCRCISDMTLHTDDCEATGKVPLTIDVGIAGFATNAYLYIDGAYRHAIAISPSTASSITTDIMGDSLPHIVTLISADGHCAISDTIIAPLCPCTRDILLTKIKDCDTEHNDIFIIDIGSTHYLADSFTVWIDEVVFTTFKYNGSDTSFTLKIKSDGFTHRIKISNPSHTCIYENVIMTSRCPCSMTLIAEVTEPCIDDYTSIVNCDLEIVGLIGNGYDVFLDNAYVKSKTYTAIGNDTFALKVKSDGKMHSILVRDKIDFTCKSESEIITKKCITDTCSLRFTNIETSPCKDNSTNIHLEFNTDKEATSNYYVITEHSSFIFTPPAAGKIIIEFTAPCGYTNIAVSEGQDGSCYIDTTFKVKLHGGTFIYYPNPAYRGKSLTLENIDSTDFDKLLPLRFYDVVGREVATYDVLGKEKIKVTLDRLPDIEGMYLFTLGSKRKYKGRVVVIR